MVDVFESTDELIKACVGEHQRVATAEDHFIDRLIIGNFFNRRLPRFDHPGFIEYWRNNHSEFAQGNVPAEVGLGYRQFHTDPVATKALLAVTGFAIEEDLFDRRNSNRLGVYHDTASIIAGR